METTLYCETKLPCQASTDSLAVDPTVSQRKIKQKIQLGLRDINAENEQIKIGERGNQHSEIQKELLRI